MAEELRQVYSAAFGLGKRRCDLPNTRVQASVPTRCFDWSREGCAFAVAYHTFGSGPRVLFLPAMSTVSSRMAWQAVAAGRRDPHPAKMMNYLMHTTVAAEPKRG